jgi:hypothetical protein
VLVPYHCGSNPRSDPLALSISRRWHLCPRQMKHLFALLYTFDHPSNPTCPRPRPPESLLHMLLHQSVSDTLPRRCLGFPVPRVFRTPSQKSSWACLPIKSSTSALSSINAQAADELLDTTGAHHVFSPLAFDSIAAPCHTSSTSFRHVQEQHCHYRG